MEGGDLVNIKVDTVIERFVDGTRTSLKASSVQKYKDVFMDFARTMDIGGYSKRQLSGRKGQKLIKDFISRKPRTYWRFALAALKAVWVYGLALNWPIETRRDFGRMPKMRRGATPADGIIARWAEAMENETDTYYRLIWLLMAQHGWRPSHLAHLKWRNVRYDSDGRPIAIVADGVKEGFKTEAPVMAFLAPDVQQVLMEWASFDEVSRNMGPDVLIVPFRSCKGEMDFKEVPSRTFWSRLKRHWNRLIKKWDLPPLKRKDVRHWVATTCRKAGLSKQASACLMGHDATAGGAMRDWYDNPPMEDIFAEQAERLPDGPLGTLRPPRIEIVADIPPEVLEVVKDYIDEKIGTMEFASRMEGLKSQKRNIGP